MTHPLSRVPTLGKFVDERLKGADQNAGNTPLG